MKFYLCSLPLCLLLVVHLFPSCDGQRWKQQQQRIIQGARPNQRAKAHNQKEGTCVVRGNTFRAGAKMVIDCELCTCLANGSKQCAPLNCMRCNKYPSLRKNPCCNKCRKMRKQQGKFDFEEGSDGEDEEVKHMPY